MTEKGIHVLVPRAALVALVHENSGVLRFHVTVEIARSDEVGLANDASASVAEHSSLQGRPMLPIQRPRPPLGGGPRQPGLGLDRKSDFSSVIVEIVVKYRVVVADADADVVVAVERLSLDFRGHVGLHRWL